MPQRVGKHQLRSTLEDIALLRDAGWLDGDLSDAELRRDVVILRKLLLEQGIVNAWAEVGPHEPFLIEARNLNRGPGSAYVELAQVGEARVKGGRSFLVLATAGQKADPRPPYVVTDATKLRLKDYLRAYCMIVDNTYVTRRDVIEYVAYDLHGVHYPHGGGRRGPPRPEALKVLSQYEILGRGAPYLQLVGIGQDLLKSPDTESLVEALRAEVPDREAPWSLS